jgi:hypothetical protein
MYKMSKAHQKIRKHKRLQKYSGSIVLCSKKIVRINESFLRTEFPKVWINQLEKEVLQEVKTD